MWQCSIIFYLQVKVLGQIEPASGQDCLPIPIIDGTQVILNKEYD